MVPNGNSSPLQEGGGPHTRWRSSRIDLAACLLLIVVNAVVFGQVLGFGFVFDDDVYVSANPAVLGGLSLTGVRWAFTTNHAEFWHPMVWISLMFDRQAFGPSPAGFHFSALLIHLANTLLLYVIVRRMTGRPRVAALTALLFSVHPLRAESVAWVSDRKDILAAFYCLLAVLSYHRYTQRPGVMRASPVVGFHVLALMCKPSVATLPLVLLVLDWWPLNRLAPGGSRGQERSRILRLATEKAPLLALSALGAVVAYWAQASRGGVAESLDLKYRVANASLSILRYPRDFFWPSDLAAFYPHAGDRTPLGAAMGAALITAGVTALLARSWRRPYLLAGWLWYLVMVVPAIGLIQVGNISHADRYTYLPLIGISLAVSSVTVQLPGAPGVAARLVVPAVAAALAVLSAMSHRQAAFWGDGFTLYTRTIAVTKYNWFAHIALGKIHLIRKEYVAAEEQFRAVLAFHATSPAAHSSIALALDGQGRGEEALWHAREAVHIAPGSATARHNLGYLLAKAGHVDEAIVEWRQAISLNPEAVSAYVNLGIALAERGRSGEARDVLREALRRAPSDRRAAEALKSLESPP